MRSFLLRMILPVVFPPRCRFGVLLAMGQILGAAYVQGAAIEAGEQVFTSEVRIDSGVLRGLVVGEKKDVCVYKGIPYAAPPVGERRWKPPQPQAHWEGVRDCFEFGAACPQIVPLLLAAIPEMAINAPMNEDCLYLNIWAPIRHSTDKLPVLYWIHGGGFVMGAASQPMYDGEELARLGGVVVSINYRVGRFGFLAHPALSAESSHRISGNYGLLDQIEGLRWVRRNIAVFGGDPDRVTVLGESAGGMSVLYLMVAPEANGLFQRAIAQSAAAVKLLRLRQSVDVYPSAEQAGVRVMAACGLDASASAQQMRKLDASVLAGSQAIDAALDAPLRVRPSYLIDGPVVDGHVIPDDPVFLFNVGREHAVPMIIGNTRSEMSLFLLGTKLPADPTDYFKQLQTNLADFAPDVADAYPAHGADQVRSAITQLTTDLSFNLESRSIARAHSAAGQATYRYLFSRGSKRGVFGLLGAHHGAELAYLFGHPLGGREDDRLMSHMLGQYWLNFAASGNPNSAELPAWSAYAVEGERMIDFSNEVTVLNKYRNAQLDLLERVSSRQTTPKTSSTP